MRLCLFIYLGDREFLKGLHLSINVLKIEHAYQNMVMENFL